MQSKSKTMDVTCILSQKGHITTLTERYFMGAWIYGTVKNLLNNRYMDTIICDKMFPGTHINTQYSLFHTHIFTWSLSVEHSALLTVMKWWQTHEESCDLCSTPLCVCPCHGHMMHIGQRGVSSLLMCQSMFGRGDQSTVLYSLTEKTIMWGQSEVKRH